MQRTTIWARFHSPALAFSRFASALSGQSKGKFQQGGRRERFTYFGWRKWKLMSSGQQSRASLIAFLGGSAGGIRLFIVLLRMSCCHSCLVISAYLAKRSWNRRLPQPFFRAMTRGFAPWQKRLGFAPPLFKGKGCHLGGHVSCHWWISGSGSPYVRLWLDGTLRSKRRSLQFYARCV